MARAQHTSAMVWRSPRYIFPRWWVWLWTYSCKPDFSVKIKASRTFHIIRFCSVGVMGGIWGRHWQLKRGDVETLQHFRKSRAVLFFTLKTAKHLYELRRVARSVSNWSQLVPIGHGQPSSLGQTKSWPDGPFWSHRGCWWVVVRTGRWSDRGRRRSCRTKGDERLKGEEVSGQFGWKRARGNYYLGWARVMNNWSN